MLRGRNTRLTPERIQKLDSVGFVWEAQRGGPRRQQRATVSVPAQAHPVKLSSKVRKFDYANYAQALGGSPSMMMPGAMPMVPFPMPPGFFMPGAGSMATSQDDKSKSREGGAEASETDENDESNGKQTQHVNSKQPFYHPQMMNPQAMAAMSWSMMSAGVPPGNPMAYGFFPIPSPYMMNPAMVWPPTPSTQAPKGNDDDEDKKRKPDNVISAEVKKQKTLDDHPVETKVEISFEEASGGGGGVETESEDE